MNDEPDLMLRTPGRWLLWAGAVVGAGMGATAVYLTSVGALGLVLASGAMLELHADDRGVRTRTLFRRRFIVWSDVAEVCVTTDPSRWTVGSPSPMVAL